MFGERKSDGILTIEPSVRCRGDCYSTKAILPIRLVTIETMRPLRIAILRSNENSSYRVRCRVPLTWLQRQQAVEVVPALKAWEADVVLLHGQWQPGGMGVARSLQRHGIRVVADLDEDIFNVNAEHPSAAMYRDPALQTRCRELLGAVDAVFVPTEYLASKLAPLSARISVVPTGINLETWRHAPKPKTRDRVHIVGFAGTASESASLEILRPVLAKLSGKLKDQEIRFVCFGFRPAWLSGVMPGADVIEGSDSEAYPSPAGCAWIRHRPGAAL